MNVLIRCDGSLEIGMGHIIRCLALADELHENHNCSIHFAIRKSELGITKVESSYPVLTSNEKAYDYEKWILECIRKSRAQVLILDVRDNLSKSELLSIKSICGVRVVTIDDPEDKRLASDLAFYPPVPQVQKMNWSNYEGNLFTGWEYVMLRKDFKKCYPSHGKNNLNILVSMGGSDEHNMTEIVINALILIKKSFNVTIILGPGYQHEKSLKKTLLAATFKYKVHINPPDIASIMSKATMAIISFGQTAYELAALKVPSLYLCITEDHSNSSQLFVRKEVGINLGLISKLNAQLIADNIKEILVDELRIEMMKSHAKNLSISNLEEMSKKILLES